MDELLKYFPNLSKHKVALLQEYVDRLLWWNARINLISRQDTSYLFARHILHSLAVATWMPFPEESRILDLGTGGGLPGIPLAIYFPDSAFTLIDGRGKKITAVQTILTDLDLPNATALHTRAEDFNGEFDFVVTRAVAPLAELWTWTKTLLVVKGKADKSQKAGKLQKSGVKEQAMKILTSPLGHEGVIWDGGLIALKGGDLGKELKELKEMHAIGEVGKNIYIMSIQDIFPEPYFLEKFIVFIPASKSTGLEVKSTRA